MAPKLANELWIEIIRLLPRSDLLSVSRSSHLLHELTEPTLYSDFDAMKHKNSPDESLMLFFRTIVKNPALARYFKRATIHVLPFNSNARTRADYETMDVSFLKPSDHAILKSQISRLMPDEEMCEYWHTTILNTPTWDSIAGFILLMVSQNLEYLNIYNYGAMTGYYNINCFMLYWADSNREMDPNIEGHRPLSQLREVNLHKNDGSGVNFMMFNAVERFLKFDSVTKFTGHGITDAIFETDGRTASPVEQITLVDCRLTNVALKNFLLSLKCLNTLEWYDSVALATCNFYNTIREVPKIKSHLEKLVISDYYETVRTTTNRAPFFDLEDFGSLKTLIVDSFSSLGPMRLVETDSNGNGTGTNGTEVDQLVTMDPMDDSPTFFYSDNRIVSLLEALPPTLEYLTITDCRYPMYDCALRIATRRDPKLSNLKELTLAFADERRSHAYVPSKGRLAEYKMIAKKHGIKLTFLEFVE